jgi:hypothetical protein
LGSFIWTTIDAFHSSEIISQINFPKISLLLSMGYGIPIFFIVLASFVIWLEGKNSIFDIIADEYYL